MRWWLLVAGLVLGGCGPDKDEVNEAKRRCMEAGQDYHLQVKIQGDGWTVRVGCIPRAVRAE